VGGIVEEARKSQDGVGSISGLRLEETLIAIPMRLAAPIVFGFGG
jgi:hypothetical protein